MENVKSDPGIYIKDYHSMGFNMIDTDGISNLARNSFKLKLMRL